MRFPELCNAAYFISLEKDDLRRLLRVVAVVGQSYKLGRFVDAAEDDEVVEDGDCIFVLV